MVHEASGCGGMKCTEGNFGARQLTILQWSNAHLYFRSENSGTRASWSRMIYAFRFELTKLVERQVVNSQYNFFPHTDNLRGIFKPGLSS